MLKQKVMVMALVLIVGLAGAASGEGMLINVNFDVLDDIFGTPPNVGPREESTLDGPFDGDGGSDLGTTWNQLLAGNGTGIVIDANNLEDSTGVRTSAGFELSYEGSVGMWSWGAPPLTMLTAGILGWDPNSDPYDLVFTSLPPGVNYDMYFASFHPNENGGRALFSTDNATTSELPQIADNGGNSGNNSTWVEGVNYVLLENVVPDLSGQIIVTVVGDWHIDSTKRAYTSGCQLVSVAKPGAQDPHPYDGETVELLTDLVLSWTNVSAVTPDSNDVYVDVWFGPADAMTLIVDATNGDDGKNTESAIVDVSVSRSYDWQVNSYANGVDKIDDPNMIVGPVWHFSSADDIPPTVDIVTLDQMTWSGEGVPINATVLDDDRSEVTIVWTADEDSLADTNLDIVIVPHVDPDDPADATVTITKTVPTGDAVTVTMTVTVGDVPVPEAATASIEIDVYDDACEMAQKGEGVSIDQTDFNANCITGLEDLLEMLLAWLDDYSAEGPADR